jgi:uncharacterized small protein (DUF1192 family)
MDADDTASPAADPLRLLAREDLDRLSVDELIARVAALEAEIARVRVRQARNSHDRSAADALFRR